MTPTPPLDPRTLADEVARVRAQLDDLRAAAAAAGRVKAQFLAKMSHELRTPMKGVLGMADLLSDMALTSEQREYVDVLTSSARSLLRVVQMPDGDGFETTLLIRAREAGRRARLPIIALTAQREDRTRCLECGMDDYLAKPVVPAELADVLDRVVAANGSHA